MSLDKKNPFITKEKDINYTSLCDNTMVAFDLAKKERVLEKIKQITKTPEEIAKLIYWFFPSITFHLLFPRLHYKNIDEYTIISEDNSRKTFQFTENRIYAELYNYLSNIDERFSRRRILRVLEHSVEFRMVNDAITNGEKIDDILIVSDFIDF